MKSKIMLLAIVLTAVLVLSGCTNEEKEQAITSFDEAAATVN